MLCCSRRDVYILELGSASRSPAADNKAIGEVLVNVQTKYEGAQAVSKDIYVILKSDQPVQWTVATHGIRGSIAIIVSTQQNLCTYNV